MTRLSTDFARTGHLATRSQLRALGHTDHELRQAVAAGLFRPVARSWLAGADAEPAAVRAVELRGVLGGESALRSIGIWVSHDTGLCVAVPHSASRLPALGEGEYRMIARRPPLATGSRMWRMPTMDALEQHLLRLTDLAHGIASVDSAVRQGTWLRTVSTSCSTGSPVASVGTGPSSMATPTPVVRRSFASPPWPKGGGWRSRCASTASDA